MKYKDLPVFCVNDVIRNEIGIVLGLPESTCKDVINKLCEKGFENYFFLSEYSRRVLVEKLTLRTPDEIHIEYPVCECCNLNCKMCTYFAPLAKKDSFVSVDAFERDVVRLSELCQDLQVFKIIGGEPLLHKEINSIIRITRKYLKKSKVLLVTNGVLLSKMGEDFWNTCRNCDCIILLTIYPIKIDIPEIERIAKSNDVKIVGYSNMATGSKEEHKRIHFPLNIQQSEALSDYIYCGYFNGECQTLKEGKLYPCPAIAHSVNFSEFFNKKLEISSRDCIDIFSVDSWKPISELFTERYPFCGYCACRKRTTGHKFGISKNVIEEWSV